MPATDYKPGVAHATVDAEMTRTAGRKKTTVAEGHEAPAVSAPIPATPKPHAEVEVALGATVGLPGFSTARFDVRLRLPCKADLASVDATYEAALAFCQRRLDEMKAAVEGGG